MKPDLASFCAGEYPRLAGTLTLYCGNRAIGEELAQEALIRVCQHCGRVRRLDNPGAWAHRVAINLAKSHFRREAAQRRARVRLESGSEEAAGGDAMLAVEVRSMVSALPQRQRVALILRHYVGSSVAETAREIGCPEGTVKRLTQKAIETLRRSIALEDKREERNAHDIEQDEIEGLLEEAAGLTTRLPDLGRIHRRGRMRLWTVWVGASAATVASIALVASLAVGTSVSNERRIPPGDPGGESPQGRLWVAAVANAEDPDNPPPMEFYSVDVDGGDRDHLLKDVPADGWSGADLSPDGTKVVFSKSIEPDGDNPQIFISNADGTGVQQLTDAPGGHLNPAWSPDGTRITFIRFDSDGNGPASELWVIDADGTNATKLLASENYLNSPSFSPDGNKIVYSDVVEEPSSEIFGIGSDVFVIDLRTEETGRLTKSPWPDLGPAWSPDGSRIAFERNVGNDPEGGDLYVMDSAGGGVTKIAENAPGDVIWSPDGRFIAFSQKVDSESNSIFVVNSEGGPSQPLAGRYDYLSLLAWRAN